MTAADGRIRRQVVRFPGVDEIEVLLRIPADVVAEISAVRDADLGQLPAVALAASSRYLAEIIVGPRREPAPAPATLDEAVALFGTPGSVLAPELPADVAARALDEDNRR